MLPRSQRVRRTEIPIEQLGIGPEDYFVLSRAEGSPTVAELVGGVGLPAGQAMDIIERLVRLGALTPVADGEAPATPMQPTPSSASDLRKRADTRRRLLLQQQLGAANTAAVLAAHASTPAPDREPAAPSPEPEPSSPHARTGPVIELVAADDPRLDGACAIPIEHQRHLLALSDHFDDLSPFEVLDLYPTDDDKAIKRAYFEASRHLHPDTYFGKSLGRYQAILSKLFARAKQAYAELRRPDVRRPYVEAFEAARRAAEATRQAELEHAREAARLEEAVATEAARQRRRERELERARAHEARLRAKLDAQVQIHLREATTAQEAGNVASAANLLRLALQADPHNPEIRRRWEDVRGVARRQRAKVAFARALQFAEYGQANEAKPLFTEAADADPLLEHLAHAADALRTTEPARARDYAMRALEALSMSAASAKSTHDHPATARLRLMLARAFAAAGQTKTALEQVQHAQQALPDDPEARALLKSLKVT